MISDFPEIALLLPSLPVGEPVPLLVEKPLTLAFSINVY